VNRKDLQELAIIRQREARILLAARQYNGAYYLAGYAIECSLKACIAKLTRKYDFPDKKATNDSYTHNLSSLIRLAGLEPSLAAEVQTNPLLGQNWSIVRTWSEESRYQKWSASEARDMVDAVSDSTYGVLQWIRQYW
jgi:HEPN domain-containing protein